MKKKLKLFSEKPPVLVLLLSIALVILIGIIKYLVKEEMSISVFYLIPVVLVTWRLNKSFWWWFISFLSTFSWLTAEIYIKTYTATWLFFWNSATRFVFFIVVAYLLESLKKALLRERESARIDSITGIPNSRLFYEIAEKTLQRAGRDKKSVTVAYIDLDNFKAVNDNYGHLIGDDLLRKVALSTRDSLRHYDIVARLGGDEFAVLLPDTDYDESGKIICRIRDMLLEIMVQNNWPVTFSIGAVTYKKPPASVDEMIQVADSNMYIVKHAGKNDIRHIKG